MTKISISRLKIQGYRSCKSTELYFSRDLTALIGPNGSGKTNILSALMLVGQLPTFAKNEAEALQKCKVEVDFLVGGKPILYRTTITYRSLDQNRDEVIDFNERWNFPKDQKGAARWIKTPDTKMHVSSKGIFLYLEKGAGARTVASSRSSLRKMLDTKTANSTQTKLFKRNERYRAAINIFASGIRYYGASQFTNPMLCPTSFEIDEDRNLRSRATDLPNTQFRFMHDLYLHSRIKPKSYETFLSLVDQRGVKLIDKIDWREVKVPSDAYEVRSGGKVSRKLRQRIMIIPTIRIGRSKLSFNQISEGTFRTLALLFYTITDESTMLVVEEPEVCVHHGLLNSLVAVMKEFGRNKQILLSTHSEAVIDNLEPEQVRLVEISRLRGTLVKSIENQMSEQGYAALKKYLTTSGNLGEFWRHSGF